MSPRARALAGLSSARPRVLRPAPSAPRPPGSAPPPPRDPWRGALQTIQSLRGIAELRRQRLSP